MVEIGHNLNKHMGVFFASKRKHGKIEFDYSSLSAFFLVFVWADFRKRFFLKK